MDDFHVDQNWCIHHVVILRWASSTRISLAHRLDDGLDLKVAHPIDDCVETLPTSLADCNLLNVYIWMITSIELE